MTAQQLSPKDANKSVFVLVQLYIEKDSLSLNVQSNVRPANSHKRRAKVCIFYNERNASRHVFVVPSDSTFVPIAWLRLPTHSFN